MNTRRGLVRSWAILAFATGYLVFQLAMIVGAQGREDKRFGFWMFAESSRFHSVLIRELDGGERVRAPEGAWTVQGRGGAETTYRWGDFVREFDLGYVESSLHAKTGMYVTLKYLREAVDYVIARIPEDHETVRLHLVVRYSKAGGPLKEVMLSSKRRRLEW